ncbi:hypothetical protein [Streptomyces sp. NPDC126499]|uniref:hypothetical protein n=1 Tax=Streptomyces sp. NPDC126499 TaxID=3155314 RepID=UPI00332198A3
MDALQGHLLDSYRAARTGQPAPPAPGTHDLAVVRALLARVRGRSGGRAGVGGGE